MDYTFPLTEGTITESLLSHSWTDNPAVSVFNAANILIPNSSFITLEKNPPPKVKKKKRKEKRGVTEEQIQNKTISENKNRNSIALNLTRPQYIILALSNVPAQVCFPLPLLLHLLEGLGPSAAAVVCDLLYLLPFLFLLHYIRVDTPAPALPLAQVLQQK